MAAGTFQIYQAAKRRMIDGRIDLNTSVIRAKLFKVDAAASVSATAVSLVTEISAAGAVANVNILSCTGLAVTALAGSATSKWDMTNLVFTASGGNATSVQYVVLYTSVSNAAICWCKLSTAAFDVTQDNTLTVTIPTAGVFVIY